VSTPTLRGNAAYGDDALDNLTSTAISGGATARSLVHNFDPAPNRLTSALNGSGADNC
jgi:hypothetical protein